MKKPDDKIIYLIPGSYDGIQTYLWSDDPAPGQEDDPEDAIKYIRHTEAQAEMDRLYAELEVAKAQLVAIQDSVVHGKCANAEPCATFCEAIATRKMFKQLQDENYILKSVNKGLSLGRNMAAEAAKSLGYKFDPNVSGLEYLIETARATVMVNQKNVDLAAQLAKAKEELIPPFLLELSKSLNETPYCVRALSWHDDKKLQDWIKSLTAKAVSDENN